MKRFILMLLCLSAWTLCGDNQQEEQRFFGQENRVPASLVIELLKLMNQCLELKLENELFPKLLQTIRDHLDKIEIDSPEKELLKQRLYHLIMALKARSKNEIKSLEDFKEEMHRILYSVN